MKARRRQLMLALPAGMATAAAGLPVLAQSPPQSEAVAPALPAVGSPLRLPAVTLVDGSTFAPAQADGQITVLYWWASTCPFCALQSPEMQKLWTVARPRGLRLLALSVDRKPEDATAYLQKKGYTFPAAWVTPEFQRVLPKPRGLPITVVRGRDGRVLQAEKGQMFAEDVEQLVRWLG